MSEQALAEAKIEGADGKAPQRTAGFNLMAQQLDAAMKGVAIPEAPAKAPEPPQKAEKPVEKPVEKAASETPKDKPVEKKPVEKPAESKAEDDEIDPESSPFNRNWKVIHEQLKERKQLKAEMAKAKSEREALLKQIEEAKKAPATTEQPKPPVELEELKSQLQREKESREKYEQELKVLALERAPEFKEHYQKRFDAAITQAQSAVPDDSKAKIADLIKLPPTPYRKQLLTEMMVDLNEYDRSILAVAISDMDRAKAERDQALKDNETNYQRLQELQAKKQAEEQKAAVASQDVAIQRVLEAARQRFDAFKPVSGNDAHNNFVKVSEDRVARFFKGQLAPEEMAILPVIASDYEVVRTQRDQLLTELEQAKKTIATYESSNPSITGGSKKEEGKAKGFKEKFLDQWNPGS